MTEMDPSLREILLDREFTRSLDQLRSSAHATFLRNIEEVRQLSVMIVSWNQELLQEVEAAMANYEALRSQLSAKMMAASALAAQDLSRVRDTTNRMAQDSHSIEQFSQHLHSESGKRHRRVA